MEIRDIEAFVAVTQLRSVSAAAESLHLTQPAVSRRILRVEEELGCAIFERVGLKMVLTPAGIVFLSRCIPLLASVKEAIRDAQYAAKIPPTLSIGLVGSLAGTDFAKKIRGFGYQHPTVNIQLRTGRSDEIAEWVAGGQLDVGLRYFEGAQMKDLQKQKVGEERFVVIASSNTKWIPNPCSIEDLQGVKWVSFPRGASGFTFASTLDALLLLRQITDGNRIEVDSLTAQKRLVEADFGLGFLVESSIEEEVKIGSLRVVNIPSFEAIAPIYALYRKSSPVLELIEAFVKMM